MGCCFYFGLPVVWPVLSAPVAVCWWIQNEWVVTLWVQELRALRAHTGLPQAWLSLFPLQLLILWDQAVQLMLRQWEGEGREEEQEKAVNSKSIFPGGHSPELLERRKGLAGMICKEGVMCPQSGVHGFFPELFIVSVTVSDTHFPHTEHQLPLCQLRVSLHWCQEHNSGAPGEGAAGNGFQEIQCNFCGSQGETWLSALCYRPGQFPFPSLSCGTLVLCYAQLGRSGCTRQRCLAGWKTWCSEEDWQAFLGPFSS